MTLATNLERANFLKTLGERPASRWSRNELSIARDDRDCDRLPLLCAVGCCGNERRSVCGSRNEWRNYHQCETDDRADDCHFANYTYPAATRLPHLCLHQRWITLKKETGSWHPCAFVMAMYDLGRRHLAFRRSDCQQHKHANSKDSRRFCFSFSG
jgi:hypothetical protein